MKASAALSRIPSNHPLASLRPLFFLIDCSEFCIVNYFPVSLSLINIVIQISIVLTHVQASGRARLCVRARTQKGQTKGEQLGRIVTS